MWDQEILDFVEIATFLEDTFARAQSIQPSKFKEAKVQLQNLRKLVRQKLTKEVNSDRSVSVKFWAGLKFQ